MSVGKTIITGIALCAMFQCAFAQQLDLDEVYGDLDENGNKRVSGEYSFSTAVPCLGNNELFFNVDYTVVIHSTPEWQLAKDEPISSWMFSAQWRQSGTAYDGSGNTWRFKGHWSVNETGANPDWQNRQHLVVVENDLLISETDAPNLKLTYTREVMWRDGVRIRRNSDFSVTCLNVNAR